MGLFSKTPEEKEEKLLVKEGKNEEKSLRQALKDLEKAHKAEHKAQKAEHDAMEDYQKAIRREERLSAELIKLQHDLEAATASKELLDREVVAKQTEVMRLGEETKRMQVLVENLQTKFRENTERRDARLEVLAGSGSNSSLPTSPAAGLAGVGAAGAAGAAAGAGRQQAPAPAVANPEATGFAAASPVSASTSPVAGVAPGQFVEVPAASSTPPVPQGAPSLPPRGVDGGAPLQSQTFAAQAPLQAGGAAPPLPSRNIDTGVSAAQSAPSPPGIPPLPAQGFAPPPRHPVADAVAPHQTSPVRTTAPQLPSRNETADSFQSAQVGYGSMPQSATSMTGPSIPQAHQRFDPGVGTHPNLLPGGEGEQAQVQAHPNLLPGQVPGQVQPGAPIQ